MKIVYSLQDIPSDALPGVLTIGKFDGMHLGHQALLESLRAKAKMLNGKSYVLTFQEHPSKVLSPSSSVLNLTTQEHKIKLLEEQQIDVLILLPFTQEFSQQTAEEFLTTLHTAIPFSALVLGHDAVIGKARHGNRSIVENMANKLNFQLEYLTPTLHDGIPISSSKIRQLLKNGELAEVQKLLGRSYSIYSKVIGGKSLGKKIDFPTANLDVKDLCLPPYGVYVVKVKNQELEEKAVANLGLAPTVRNDNSPLLEVHLIKNNCDLYGKYLEVVFYKFLRSENKFDNLEALRSQIAKDVTAAKNF
jgi:riboflavin kinase/FMN adenylyltransferase